MERNKASDIMELELLGNKYQERLRQAKKREQVAQEHMVNDIQKRSKLFDRLLTTG